MAIWTWDGSVKYKHYLTYPMRSCLVEKKWATSVHLGGNFLHPGPESPPSTKYGSNGSGVGHLKPSYLVLVVSVF